MTRPVEEPPHYRAERVRRALAQDERVNEVELTVNIKGSRVFVSGVLPNDARRAAVTDVVQEVLPGHEVVNETTALDVAPAADEPERLG